MYYRRLCVGLADKGRLYPTNEITIKDNDKDHYLSIFEYNDNHLHEFKSKGTVAGIVDVTTTRLVWDFDNKDNPDLARNDALELAGRLREQGLEAKHVRFSFSGKKGFAVEVETTYRMSVREFKNITAKLAHGLETYDSVVSNASRIVRVQNTKHQDSGLFKIPLTYQELKNFSIDGIKDLAKTPRTFPDTVEAKEVYIPNQEFIDMGRVTVEVVKPAVSVTGIDMAKKPKHMSNCRWMLQNGAFGTGQRDFALLTLAAYYKNQGFDQAINYRMLKGVAEIQAARNNVERFSDNEIWTNIIGQVYGPNWKNGQFSCREEGSDLHSYCSSLGIHKCNHAKNNLTVEPSHVFELFKEYASKYEENVLFTGIQSLDKHAKFMVGTSNAFVGPPGIGKTSIVSQILNHNSNQDIMSIFFSYDMFHSALYMRLIQRHTGLTQDDVYDIFRNDPKRMMEINELIKDNYKNVRFCFKAGQSTEEIEETILDTQEKTGKKVKLAIVDYNELVSAPMADATAASAHVAQRLRQIANEKEVCMVTLLQPSKLHSTPGDEVTSFNAAKGSSAIAQSMTTMLGLSRPGFNPRNPVTDTFFNITCLKNRNGGLFSLDFSWDGLKGQIGELTPEEKEDLAALRNVKKAEKENDNGNW